MTIYAILDDNNRVVMWGNSQFGEAKAYIVEDYDHFYQNSFCYYFKDNKLIYDDKARENAEKKETLMEQISELKTKLIQSDYKALKFAEGWITTEQYTDVLNQRQAWRDEINSLTERLEQLDD